MAKLVFSCPYMRAEYPLDKPETMIGRLPGNDISIPDYALFKKLAYVDQQAHVTSLVKISRQHARVIRDARGYLVEDLGTRGVGSSYGTYVNGVRLEAQKPYLLQSGDAVRFGTVECKFFDEEAVDGAGKAGEGT